MSDCCCGGLSRNHSELGIMWDLIKDSNWHNSVSVDADDLSDRY
jgi:hypothetical protein